MTCPRCRKALGLTRQRCRCTRWARTEERTQAQAVRALRAAVQRAEAASR